MFPLHCTSDSMSKGHGELEVVRARLAEKEAVIEQLQQQLVQGLNDLKDTQVRVDVLGMGDLGVGREVDGIQLKQQIGTAAFLYTIALLHANH